VEAKNDHNAEALARKFRGSPKPDAALSRLLPAHHYSSVTNTAVAQRTRIDQVQKTRIQLMQEVLKDLKARCLGSETNRGCQVANVFSELDTCCYRLMEKEEANLRAAPQLHYKGWLVAIG